MVIDGNRLILIIGKKILFKKNSKSELSPKKYARPGLDEVSTLKFFLNIHFLRIIKNSWLLWRLFATDKVRVSSTVLRIKI